MGGEAFWGWEMKQDWPNLDRWGSWVIGSRLFTAPFTPLLCVLEILRDGCYTKSPFLGWGSLGKEQD